MFKNSIKAKLMIWDTSGSERYKSVTVGHYRDASGAILVCDVTSLESFNNLDIWLEEIRNHASSNWEILLIPNKLDIVKEDNNKRMVNTKQLREYSRINNLLYAGECSAETDINVKDSINLLVKKIYVTHRERGILAQDIVEEMISNNIILSRDGINQSNQETSWFKCNN